MSQGDECGQEKGALPAHAAGTDTFGIVLDYVRAAISDNTLKAHPK